MNHPSKKVENHTEKDVAYYSGPAYKMIVNDMSNSELVVHITEPEGFTDYSAIRQQNILLDEQIQKIKSEYSTDNQNVAHVQEKIMSLKVFNFVLFLMYYVCVIAVIYVLFVLDTTYSLYAKIAIIITFVFYPYIIPLVQKGILFLYHFIRSLIHGDVYKPGA